MNYELFNVEEVKHMKDGGYMLSRYPLDVIKKIGYENVKKGREKAKQPAMCEIRFYSKSSSCKVVLKSMDSDCNVFCFIDGFQCKNVHLKKNKKQEVTFEVHERMIKNKKSLGFSEKYFYRIIFGSNSRIVFYSIENETSTFEKKELPLVLYGSSISQGTGSNSIIDSYAFLLSQSLNIDILNKGLSGSCLLEKEVVDYISLIKCRGFILEIGCNVRGVMDENEFEKRFKYLIERISYINNDKPIFIINILEIFELLYKGFDEILYHDKNVKFISIIKKQVKLLNKKNIHLISGKKLITRNYGISGDLLHPSNLGHREMCDKLSKIMMNYLKEK